MILAQFTFWDLRQLYWYMESYILIDRDVKSNIFLFENFEKFVCFGKICAVGDMNFWPLTDQNMAVRDSLVLEFSDVFSTNSV